MDIIQLLKEAVERTCSDIYIIAGRPLTCKIHGQLELFGDNTMDSSETEELIKGIYVLAGNRDMTGLICSGDDDFSFALPGISRYRVSAYKQRGSLAAVIRVVNFVLPDPDAIGIPEEVLAVAGYTSGLVLVTGPAGSGKSTTLACMVDWINRTRTGHIITLEDPLEYLHRHNKSIVSQREISTDTDSYAKALRSALRQAPDVILLGDMQTPEVIQLALTAAEAGHLIISSLHTVGAVSTLERIIDSFPTGQQQQVCLQLSTVLRAVVSQQLIAGENQTVVPAFEWMNVNDIIRSCIRTGQIDQVEALIQGQGMRTMEESLLEMHRAGLLTEQDVIDHSGSPDSMKARLLQI